MSERATIREAARQLGVSMDTVRRRLKSGVLQGERVSGQYGPTWYVILPDQVSERDTATQSVSPMLGSQSSDTVDFAIEIAAMGAELRVTREWNEQLRGELETRDEEVRRRDTVIAQLAATVESLNAPVRALMQSDTAEAEPSIPLDVPPSEPTESVNVSHESAQTRVTGPDSYGNQPSRRHSSRRRHSPFGRLRRLVLSRLSLIVVLSLAIVAAGALTLAALFSVILRWP